MTVNARRIIKSAARIFCTLLVLVLIAGGCVSQPSFKSNGLSDVQVKPAPLQAHVRMLSETFHPRDWTHPQNLEKCADYIAMQFQSAGASVTSQVFQVKGVPYRNVIGRFGTGAGPRIIVGAHYDSCDDSPGADDNASGVAALIELAHLLGREQPAREIELVAYVLEEPPFFRTPYMGSAVHASSVAGEKIKGVIVLEMVGCFKDERGSQSYPSLLLDLIYPGRGNFIAVVGLWKQEKWIKAVKVGMKGTTDLPIYSIRAPAFVPGVDFSDHMNYWPHGINALMITDTAFYRNSNYHTIRDTADTLDYDRMSQVVVAVFESLQKTILL